MLKGAIEHATENTAEIYDRAGAAYSAYADGDPSQIFDFSGPHAQADRCVWSCLAAKLAELRISGATSVRILDAGCGPGAWVRRLVTRAKEMGFSQIIARGFDISPAQIQQARVLARNLAALPGVELTFSVADLRDPLPEADGSVDIALCLYSALSHLPVSALPQFSTDIARATAGHFITTVRSIGSMPTALVDSIENVRLIRHDDALDQCEIEFSDGQQSTFPFHLFSSSELREFFSGAFDIELMQGLDLFHSRFAIDPRWNPENLPFSERFVEQLSRLEDVHSLDPQYMDHANHILLLGRRKGLQGAAAEARRKRWTLFS